MEYTAIILPAVAGTAVVVYVLANRALGVRLQLRSVMLCAAFGLIASLLLPRAIVGFAGVASKLGFLALCTVIFAYFVAYYDDRRTLPTTGANKFSPPVTTEPKAPDASDKAPAASE